MGDHTPAKWFADGNEIRWRPQPDTNSVIVARFAGNNDEALANAVLAAAAPDLLEALQDLAGILDSDIRSYVRDSLQRARAAIASATGAPA